MCVGRVCTHPSYNDKIHPIFFLIPILISLFSNQAVLRFLSEWHNSVQAAPMIDWQGRLTWDPPWVKWVSYQSAILSTPVQGKTRCLWLSDWDVLLLEVIMNKAVIIYSRHLSRWRRRGFTFFLKGMRRSRSAYVRANHSWSSFIFRRSIRVLYDSLKIAFSNNMVVSQFWGWSLQHARPSTEERGGVSRVISI